MFEGVDPTKQGEESHIKLEANAHIPHSEIFGIKLVNNEPTRATISFNNSETFPLTLAFAVGQLSSPQTGVIVRNLTAVQYSKQVPAQGSLEVIYTFTTEMHPQDLNLRIVAMMLDQGGSIYSVPVMEETVSIVEAPTSLFDPQM
jgi:predicted amino acid racemase